MKSSLKTSDEVAAKGAKGRRVTLESLKDKVAHSEFWRPEYSPTSTVCALTTTTGYTVFGSSGCADPDNFDAEKGQHFAFEDALRKLWPLEGYRLNIEVHQSKGYSA